MHFHHFGSHKHSQSKDGYSEHGKWKIEEDPIEYTLHYFPICGLGE